MIFFSFIPSLLWSLLLAMCPVSIGPAVALAAGGEGRKTLASRKALVWAVEEVNGSNQRDGSGWQLRRSQEEDRFGDWVVWAMALSCISRISVSHLPGMLSSFLAQPCSCLSLKQLKKKLYSETVLRNCVTRLPGLTKLWTSYRALTAILDGLADNFPIWCYKGLALFDQVIRNHVMSSCHFWRATTEDTIHSVIQYFLFKVSLN